MKTAIQILDEMIKEELDHVDKWILYVAKERIQKETGLISVSVSLPRECEIVTHWTYPLPLPPNK